jgi:hypothetical protein
LYDAFYYQMSCKPDYRPAFTPDAHGKTDLYFNGPLDVTIPELRYGTRNTAGTGGLPLIQGLSGFVSGAAGTPIVINSPGHNLPQGALVTIAGVQGNTAANGKWKITLVDANNFSLNGSASSATPYTSGGVWGGRYPKIGDAITSPWTDLGQPPNSIVGSDLIVNDVVSFDAQVLVPGIYAFDFINLPPIPAPTGAVPFQNTAYTGVRVFDTWRQEAIANNAPFDYTNWNPSGAGPDAATIFPLPATIVGIQVSLRIWDVRTQKTRQITIIQDS